MAEDSEKQVVVATFGGVDAADTAYMTLKEQERDNAIQIEDAAILSRDYDSKLHIRDVEDMTGTRGVVLGGVTGAVIGAMTGPVGWAMIGGAAVGGLVAKLRDSGFEQHRLEQAGAALQPGSSALVVLVHQVYADDVATALRPTAHEVMTMNIDDNVAAELESVHT